MQTLFYKEPKLLFSTPGEFFVRLIVYSSYVLLSVTTLFLFLSETFSMRWLGFLFALFLIDRVIHMGEAEKRLLELKGHKVNLAQVVTPAAYKVLNYSFRKSRATRQDFYLIMAKFLASQSDIGEALRRLNINPKEFSQKIDEYLKQPFDDSQKKETINSEEILLSVENLVIIAYENAVNTAEKFIEPRNLFVALTTVKNSVIAKLFETFELATVDIQETVIFGRWRKKLAGLRHLPAVLGGFANRPKFLRHRIMNRAWTARPTRFLDQFSTDLTDLARAEQIGFLIGHKREFDQLLNIISRPGKPNAILVGDAGIGKTAIIAHLAFEMTKDRVPSVLFDKRLISLDIGSLVANATSEVLAGRIQSVAEEIIQAGNIVLFIPNIHDLFRTSQTRTLNAVDLLLPIIKSESIPVIGETYPREFKQYVEPRSDFLEQFEVVNIEEISEDETVRFLVYNGLMLEREFGVLVTFRAIKKAVQIAHRYFRDKVLPGSALDLLKQAFARAKQEGLKTLEENTVIQVAEEKSKIPIQKADIAETEKLLNLESIIHERLINQESAVKAVAGALREYRSGLSRKGGPIAAFLFVGPTGVGKTELAKILTKVQFGSKELMLRFDMSEYQDKQSIFRFIGTPDGERTGALTDAVLQTPYGLVLLDEFEKAHPDILNLFLQVFDDGRLTDSLGRTVNFENTIIIATSNANSQFIKEEIEKGKTAEEIAEEIKKKLTNYFKPELINRFSSTIVFRDLNVDEINLIAGLLLKEINETLRETHGIEFVADKSAIKKIAELGYSPVFGARPLRQVISEQVRGILAEKILRKEIERGNIINFSYEKGRFEFKKKS
ncbi:MAG: ATP-dependent Clp protease ATP-binding subunit [Patescibacteria group bacterium]|nr:ATP-dependent Clp protease ATP-binding subunit [Patescibacteria group bacterium]